MQAPFGARVIARVSKVIAFVCRGHPHAGLSAVVEHNLFGQHEAEIVLEKFAVGFDVDRKPVEMIDASHVYSARGVALRLVLEGRLEFGRRLIPFGLVVDLKFVTVRIPELKCLAVAEIAVTPADIETRHLQGRCTPLQRLWRTRPECHMTQTRSLSCRSPQRG